MSDFLPKAGVVKRGLGPAAQRLEAARAKAEQQKSGGKHAGTGANVAAKANTAGSRKASFQRKAV